VLAERCDRRDQLARRQVARGPEHDEDEGWGSLGRVEEVCGLGLLDLDGAGAGSGDGGIRA
jgi:hypothetical protein